MPGAISRPGCSSFARAGASTGESEGPAAGAASEGVGRGRAAGGALGAAAATLAGCSPGRGAGFRPGPYHTYSAPWFHFQREMRGGAFATHALVHDRRYRNFFLPQRTDVVAGFRRARDG